MPAPRDIHLHPLWAQRRKTQFDFDATLRRRLHRELKRSEIRVLGDKTVHAWGWRLKGELSAGISLYEAPAGLQPHLCLGNRAPFQVDNPPRDPHWLLEGGL
ncbi:MAG: hypothetical protein ACP5U2_04655 [Bryobacteraceae bacterium]